MLRFGDHGCQFAGVTLVLDIFAVADDDEGVILLASFLQRLGSQMHRGGQVRSSDRGPGFVDLIDHFSNSTVVNGEGGVNVRTACKAEEADPLVRHRFQQLVDDDFGLSESVGLHVADAHAFRNIQCDHDIPAKGFLLFDAYIGPWSCQRQDDGGAGREQKEKCQPRGQGTTAFEQGRPQARGDKNCPRPLTQP